MMTIAHAWVTLMQSLATIALILTAIGLMLGIVKPSDALKHVGAVLGMVVVLILIPRALLDLWSDISPWQWIGLATIGIAIWQWQRPRQQARKKREG